MWGNVKRLMNVNDDDANALRTAHPEAWSSPGSALDYYTSNPEKYQEVMGALSLMATG